MAAVTLGSKSLREGDKDRDEIEGGCTHVTAKDWNERFYNKVIEANKLLKSTLLPILFGPPPG